MGCVVGRIHSSVYIGDVDFLAKYVVFQNDDYHIYRPEVETHARLIMPEELNPNKRERPDAEIAAERFLGHLLDNPFCPGVRKVCFDMLNRLKNMYQIEFIDITDDMRKVYPWRG